MRHELRKIRKDGRLCLLFLAVLVLNGVLFSFHCTDRSKGYTMADLKPLYEDVETVLAENPLPDEELLQILAQLGLEPPEQTGSGYGVVDRVMQVRNYQTMREELVRNSELKLKLGLFQGFEEQSLRRGIERYKNLAHIQPEEVYLGGVELLLCYSLSELCLLFICLLSALTLFTHERGSGLQSLTQITKRGHGRLFVRKVLACVALMSVGFVVLYGSNALICGLEHLGVPVQSLYGYDGCPVDMTVGGLLLRVLGYKYLWALSCVGVTVLLCTATASGAVAVLALLVCSGVAYWMGGSSVLWLRHMSLAYLSQPEQLYKGALYLNLFGLPVVNTIAAVLFLPVLFVACISGAKVLYNRPRPAHSKAGLALSKVLPAKGVRVLPHEVRKELILRKGAAVLLLLVVIQVFCYRTYPNPHSQFEWYYKHYSQQLEGLPNGEKDALIDRESQRAEALHAQMEEYIATHSELGKEYFELEQELRFEDGFLKAKKQYGGLEPGQSYLYQTGYDRIFGPEAHREDLLDWAKALLAVVLLLSGIFAYERECGMAVLQRSAGKSRQVTGGKVLIAAGYTVLVSFVSFIPKLLAVFGTFGGFVATAQANSISTLAGLPDFLSVWMVLVILVVVKTFIAALVAAAVCWASKRSPNTMIALLTSMVIALVPLGIALAVG